MSQKIAATAAKAGKPNANHQRNSRVIGSRQIGPVGASGRREVAHAHLHQTAKPASGISRACSCCRQERTPHDQRNIDSSAPSIA